MVESTVVAQVMARTCLMVVDRKEERCKGTHREVLLVEQLSVQTATLVSPRPSGIPGSV